MTWFDLKNLKFEFLTKFRYETYVYWIYGSVPEQLESNEYEVQDWYTQTTFFNPKTSDNDKFDSSTEFWVETYAYWIYLEYLAKFYPNLTVLTQVWPPDDLIWPHRILNLYSGQNSESNHMYIGYISIYLPDSTLISRLWPKFDPSLTSWWPDLTLKNLEFKFWIKFWVETYVCSVYFD